MILKLKESTELKKSANKKLSAIVNKKRLKERRIKKILHSENLLVPPDEVDNCKQSGNSEYNSESRRFTSSAGVVCSSVCSSWSFSFRSGCAWSLSSYSRGGFVTDWSGYVGFITFGYVGFVTFGDTWATCGCCVTSCVTS